MSNNNSLFDRFESREGQRPIGRSRLLLKGALGTFLLLSLTACKTTVRAAPPATLYSSQNTPKSSDKIQGLPDATLSDEVAPEVFDKNPNPYLLSAPRQSTPQGVFRLLLNSSLYFPSDLIADDEELVSHLPEDTSLAELALTELTLAPSDLSPLFEAEPENLQEEIRSLFRGHIATLNQNSEQDYRVVFTSSSEFKGESLDIYMNDDYVATHEIFLNEDGTYGVRIYFSWLIMKKRRMSDDPNEFYDSVQMQFCAKFDPSTPLNAIDSVLRASIEFKRSFEKDKKREGEFELNYTDDPI